MPSQLEFSGNESFEASADALWSFLTEIQNLPKFAPHIADPTFPDADTMNAKLASAFNFLHGSLELTVKIADRVRPASAKMTVTAKGVGNRAIIEGTIQIAADPANTLASALKWSAVAKLEGLLKAVSAGLIEGAARKVIAETFHSVRAEMKTNAAK